MTVSLVFRGIGRGLKPSYYVLCIHSIFTSPHTFKTRLTSINTTATQIGLEESLSYGVAFKSYVKRNCESRQAVLEYQQV